jgi:quercetin 2,3-dioxygenase
MIEIRRAAERGVAERGWLSSRHTFSFGNYHDPEQIGFSDLLVINDDRVVGSRGFGKHAHRDMEIFSYVLEGALEHKDSMGTGTVIRPGDVQMMSAGTGITHSEFNHSKTEAVHFLRLIISPDGQDGSLGIYQDVRVYAGLFDGAESQALEIPDGRHAYVHVARGSILVNGVALQDGDGARVREEPRLIVSDGDGAEALIFDLRPHENPQPPH